MRLITDVDPETGRAIVYLDGELTVVTAEGDHGPLGHLLVATEVIEVLDAAADVMDRGGAPTASGAIRSIRQAIVETLERNPDTEDPDA